MKPLPKVLLVDDDLITRDVASIFLEGVCELIHTPNGKTALDLVKKTKYDAILMDINLKIGMNGLMTAQEIRKIPGYENTPIIAFTAYAMVGDKEEFLSKGCTHYISKPFNKTDLVKLIEEVTAAEE